MTVTILMTKIEIDEIVHTIDMASDLLMKKVNHVKALLSNFEVKI